MLLGTTGFVNRTVSRHGYGIAIKRGAAPQGVPTVLIARTDADSATLLTSDIDDADKAFCTGERTPEGFFKVRSGVEVRGFISHPGIQAGAPHLHRLRLLFHMR